MERIHFDSLPQDVQDTLDMIHLPGQDTDLCISTLRDIVSNYPGFVPARLNLAALQLQIENTEAAEETYREVLKDFPDETGALGGLSTVLLAKKEFDEAETLAKKALDAGYDWSPLYAVIGTVREFHGDVEAASTAYLDCYRRSPHSWDCLEHYCRLNNRPYVSPMDALESLPEILNAQKLSALIDYIDTTAHTPDETGEMPGCNHTFSFTEQWAEQHGIDIIELYQFLNAHGGFCDCEVCFNVEESFQDSN